MKPERELRRNSVSWALIGVSMMRSPIGSVPASAPSSVRNMPPWGLVFGTVALSTTLIQGEAGIDVKYLAAVWISSSVMVFANAAINWVLGFRGSEVFRALFRKSVIC